MRWLAALTILMLFNFASSAFARGGGLESATPTSPFTSSTPFSPAQENEDSNEPKVTIQRDKESYWRDERWSVYAYPEEDSCEIGIVPKEGEYLTLRHDPRDKTAHLMITNNAATSKGDGETVSLDIVFLVAKDFGKRWNDTKFIVKVMPNGNRALISEALNQNFLSAFAESEVLAVVTKSWSIVGGLNLSKSALAVKALRQCALEAAELNPNDPFLEGI